MRIKLWGVRGAIPTPLNTAEYRERLVRALQHARAQWAGNSSLSSAAVLESMPDSIRAVVGGETTCIEVTDRDQFIILGLGTGARRLGYDMMARGIKGDVHVLVTRTSWDNIQGWPFFIPGYIPGNTMHFHSGYADCGKRFRRQQHFDHFPKDFDDMMSTREFHAFQPGDSFNIGSVKVRTRLINDPGNAIAYRLETDSGVAVFAPDAGFPADLLEEQIVAQKDFFEAADLLVMGARYEREDGIQKYNTGWSYPSAIETTVRCALQWKARRLVMIQHEPEHLDQSIETLLSKARECLEQHGPGKMEIVIGAEGQSFEV